MPVPNASSALARFTVLDLTRVRAGPTAVRQLADWGANVVKVELPEHLDVGEGLGGARHGPDFQNLHRNKRGITLDLKSPEGAATFRRLAAKADVVVENFRPDVKTRLGIDYPALSKVNPRLVYASISGFGQDGPYRERPGVDQIAQGLGGLMSITGEPGRGPMRVGIPIADLSAGLFCALGILVALLEREQSGKGQEVATSLLQAQIFMLDFQASRWLNAARGAGAGRQQSSDQHPDRRVQDARRPHQHRHRRRRDVEAPVQGDRRAGAAGQSALRHRARAPEEPRRAQCRDRQLSRRSHQRGMDRAAEHGRRAVRHDQHHRQGVRRPAGRRIWASCRISRRAMRAERCTWSASRCRSRARRAGSRHRRRSGASTPRRSCASSASPTPRSPACAQQGDLIVLHVCCEVMPVQAGIHATYGVAPREWRGGIGCACLRFVGDRLLWRTPKSAALARRRLREPRRDRGRCACLHPNAGKPVYV